MRGAHTCPTSASGCSKHVDELGLALLLHLCVLCERAAADAVDGTQAEQYLMPGLRIVGPTCPILGKNFLGLARHAPTQRTTNGGSSHRRHHGQKDGEAFDNEA